MPQMRGKGVFMGDIFDKMACVFKFNPAKNIDGKDSNLDDISSVSKS